MIYMEEDRQDHAEVPVLEIPVILYVLLLVPAGLFAHSVSRAFAFSFTPPRLDHFIGGGNLARPLSFPLKSLLEGAIGERGCYEIAYAKGVTFP